jgi:hypothetical protein
MTHEDRLVSLAYLVCLVCLLEPDRPNEPDQPSPVPFVSLGSKLKTEVFGTSDLDRWPSACGLGLWARFPSPNLGIIGPDLSIT